MLNSTYLPLESMAVNLEHLLLNCSLLFSSIFSNISKFSSYTYTAIVPFNILRVNVYLEESGLDILIVHELRKDEKLFPQELVGEVDLQPTDVQHSLIPEIRSHTHNMYIHVIYYTQCTKS